MRYWWVNQNQTFQHEVQGGFLWSPKTNKGGGRNPFYDNMLRARPGDLVLSFSDTLIKAVGTVEAPAESATKPAAFGKIGDQWGDEGWLVWVEFKPAIQPVRPKDIIDELRPFLASKYAPLQANGNGNQGVYLTEVSEDFAAVILGKMGRSVTDFVASELADVADDIEADSAEQAIQGRTDIGATQKKQLVNARRGQGIFRANVRLNEKACRVTGVSDQRFLVASHIKPWKDSSDLEKLDGCNGLLLAPHIDRLFDRGLISFEDDGTIIKSPKLPAAVWTAWQLDGVTKVPSFAAEQATYLAHHRTAVFAKK